MVFHQLYNFTPPLASSHMIPDSFQGVVDLASAFLDKRVAWKRRNMYGVGDNPEAVSFHAEGRTRDIKDKRRRNEDAISL